MKVALIADTDWLGAQLVCYQGLAAGLSERQVAVTHVWPEDAPAEWLAAGAERVAWRPSPWGRAQQKHMAGLAQPLERLGVSLIHALDGQVWAGAVKLGQRLGVPVLLSCDRAADLPRAERAPLAAAPGAVAYAAATPALAQALASRVGAAVPCIPPGIAPSSAGPIRPARGAEADLSIVVSGDGACDDDMTALFEAIGQACAAERRAVQFFCDGQGADLHELWQAAARLDLLPRVSLVPARLGRSELLLSADLLIQPQALGMVRPVTLAAMARGVPVLARRDRWLDYLEHDQTAVVLEDPDVPAWTAWLGRFIADPDGFQPLAQRAREWVARRHTLAGQVGQTVDLYRRLAGEAIPFPR
jgi:hypothetical protein